MTFSSLADSNPCYRREIPQIFFNIMVSVYSNMTKGCQVRTSSLLSERDEWGPSVARNDGRKRATGEFLAFLDQDDLWEPRFLEATVALLQTMKEDVAFIHTDRYLITINNVILNSHNTRNSSHNHLAQLLMGGSLKNATIGLFRKTAFDAVQGFDENVKI